MDESGACDHGIRRWCATLRRDQTKIAEQERGARPWTIRTWVMETSETRVVQGQDNESSDVPSIVKDRLSSKRHT